MVKKIILYFFPKYHFHTWEYKSDEERICSVCKQHDIYISDVPISGMANDSYWETIKE